AALVTAAAPARRAPPLAAEMPRIAGDAVGLALLVRLRPDDLPAAERLGGRGLRRRAGRHLDAELGLGLAHDRLGILRPARQVDRHAAEHDDVDAGRRHLARRLHADVVGLVDLALAALD